MLLLSFEGYDGTSTAVIFPPATVIFTCTGPQRFVETAPVNVPSASAPVPLAFAVVVVVDCVEDFAVVDGVVVAAVVGVVAGAAVVAD